MAWGIFGCRHAHRFARTNIKLGPVPWADQAVFVEFTVTEGATVMGAHVFDAVDLSIDFDNHHESVVDLKGLRLVSDIVDATFTRIDELGVR